MPGRVQGKVAFITGAAAGRAAATPSGSPRRAPTSSPSTSARTSTRYRTTAPPQEDLAETVKAVEALDRRIVASKADVRDYASLKSALDDGVAELGRLDIVSANAGIFSTAPTAELTEEEWGQMIDINLTGVWRTCKAAIPHLIANNGGSIIITSSGAGLKGFPNFAHYVSAKHGVVGLMRTLALELAPHSIRVNSSTRPT